MNKIKRQTHRKKQPDQLERLWEDLLSRQPELIRAAFDSFDKPRQKAVFTHLQRMVSEVGWQPEQQVSAKAAIQALETQSDQE